MRKPSRQEKEGGESTVEMQKASLPAKGNGAAAQVRGSWLYLSVKRVFDLTASAAALVVCSPLMLAIAALVKLESPGPAIFKQERVGMNGVPFTMYKFRSMRLDAEKDGPKWAEADDERCTKVGRVIRRFHVDELPQLWNIIRGEMSIVGPRPEREFFYQEIEETLPEYRCRLQVKPGLTGLSQVNGCYNQTFAERLAYDVEYMQKRSIDMDLHCIFKTVWVVLNGDGAR